MARQSTKPVRQKRQEKRGHEPSSYRAKNPHQITDIFEPIGDRQEELVASICTNTQTIVTGPAGTGKTYVAARMAASMLDNGEVQKIVLTRPNVASGPTLGLFPGTMEEKMAEWTVPIMAVFNEVFGESHVKNLIRNGKIEVVPFETMRGRTFDNAFVILDEAQNTTPHEMKMFLTRIGEHSKVVINGDTTQRDSRGRFDEDREDGLSMAVQLVARFSLPVGVAEFGIDDVVRSGITAQWVKAFYQADI